jgi:hypothetical protein
LKKLVYLIVSLLCVMSLPVTGCDFMDSLSNISCESSTKVEVTVNIGARVLGTGYKPSGESYEGLYPGIQVEFQISKTGGESFTQYRTTNEKGETDTTNVGYNLRKGEVITVTATTMGTGTPVSETITLGYEKAKPYNAEKGVTSEMTWWDIITLRVPPHDPDLYPEATQPKENAE